MMFLMFIRCYFNIGQDDLDSIVCSFMVKFDGCRVSRGFDMFTFAWGTRYMITQAASLKHVSDGLKDN